MASRKWIGSACLAAGLLLGFQSNALAYDKPAYDNQVRVSLGSASSLPFKLESLFELENLSSGEKTLLVPGVYLTAAASGTVTTITAGNDSYQSSAGFRISEVQNASPKYAKFTSATGVYKGASTTGYEKISTMKKAEAAEYLSSFTDSSGTVWYNIQLAGGSKGWVSSASTLLADAPSSLSLFSYKQSGKSKTSSFKGTAEIKSSGGKATLYNLLGMEDYVKGVIPNEMATGWPTEALKAQAIVARSYAEASKSVSSTPSSQVYNGYTSEAKDTNAAVDATKGQVVQYNGKTIQAFFFSTSGGRTANIGEVWNSTQVPYLVSVSDPYEESRLASWTEEFRSSALIKSFGLPAGTALYSIKANAKGANGEVGSVTLITSAGTVTKAGNESVIRHLFPTTSNSYGYLMSNWFTLTAQPSITVQGAGSTQNQYSIKGASVMTASGETTVSDASVQVQTTSGTVSQESDPASITVDGKGWGHRIGMSQYGAKGYANHGYTAEQIIAHYYPGTTIRK
ncbi:SpoIID/LytB domain-containing protein [Metabacillus sp. GX 13764]|uniref:SpoIID/LytB domain-containing protein n=1 Tax=Metabacillus kandeliae TaxID=2900151 RepID=UPI001E611686|nr:SpoIID/LytB domain-containing protein [Metabacillus kandeliae]MCD7034464.1 SpoIID/LytB domain-containing protein [Metabacillus kandeliae]